MYYCPVFPASRGGPVRAKMVRLAPVMDSQEDVNDFDVSPSGVVALECNVCRSRDVRAQSCSRCRCLRLCFVRWDSCTDTAALRAPGHCCSPTAM